MEKDNRQPIQKEALGPEPTPNAELTEEQKRDELLARPFLGIDKDCNLTLHIPLTKTGEIISRGMIDMARSQVLSWYAKVNKAQAEEQAKIAHLAAMTGYARFTDKIGGMLRRK